MPAEFTTVRCVEFADTDMAGIVHFAQFFRYMEAAEHEFFRTRGLRLHENKDGGMEGWARVEAQCHYLEPLTYGDTVAIDLRLGERGRSWVTWELTFRRVDPGPERLVARGRLKTVFVRRAPGAARMLSAAIPEAVARALEAAAPPPAGPPREGP